MLKSFLAAGLVLGLSANPLFAQVRPGCAERTAIVDQLSQKYSESHIASGMQPNNTLVELWTAQSGSWTIIVTHAEGVSCVVAAGQYWSELTPVLPSVDG